MTIKHFSQIESIVRRKERGRIAVAAAHDSAVLQSVNEVCRQGFACPILIGDKEKVFSLADEQGIDVSGMTIIKELDEAKCAQIAVSLVQSKEADVIMKGMLQTRELLGAVLEKEKILRDGVLLSHIGLCEVPGFERLLYVADGGINIAPDLKQKVAIVENVVAVAQALGLARPRVAALAAVETVNPAMPSTLDAAALAKMAQRGQITGCELDGPLGMDNAVSPEAARQKHISSEVAGAADILLVPDIEAGNIMVKTLIFMARARSCGIITGARVPLVVTSRAENSEAKYYSILLALAMLDQAQEEK